MRRERSAQSNETEEKKSLNQTVASLKAATATFASTQRDTRELQKQQAELQKSVESLKNTESSILENIERAKKWFRDLEQEHAAKLADFRRELIVPPALVREKEEITKSIEEGKAEVFTLDKEYRERYSLLKAEEEKLNKDLEKKRGQVLSLTNDAIAAQKRLDVVYKELNTQQGLIAQRESTIRQLESSISSLKNQEIDIESAVTSAKKESLHLDSLNKEKKTELVKMVNQLETVKKGLDNSTMSVISLAKREDAVKKEEVRLRKVAQKFGVTMNI